MSASLKSVMPAREDRETVAPPPPSRPRLHRRWARTTRTVLAAVLHGAKSSRDAVRSGVLQFAGLGAFASAGFTVNVTLGLVVTGLGLFAAEWLTSSEVPSA